MSLAYLIQTRHKCSAEVANQVLQTYIAHAGDRPPSPINMIEPEALRLPARPTPLMFTDGESDESWVKRSQEYRSLHKAVVAEQNDIQSKYDEALKLYQADVSRAENYNAWVTGLELQTPLLVKEAKAEHAAKKRPQPVQQADKRKRRPADQEDEESVAEGGRRRSGKKMRALSNRKQMKAVSPESVSGDEVEEPRVQRENACRACVANNQICLREARDTDASHCLACQESNVKCERAPDGSLFSDEKLNAALEAHRMEAGNFEECLKTCFQKLQDDLIRKISTPVTNDTTSNALLGRMESGVDILQSLLDVATRIDIKLSYISEELPHQSPRMRHFEERGMITDVQDESTMTVPSVGEHVFEGTEDSGMDLSQS